MSEADERTPVEGAPGVPELPVPRPVDPAGLAVRAAINDGLRRLLIAAPAAIRGEVAGVHQTRVATRRLRSDLRTFGPLIAPEWARSLSDPLRELGRTLGGVRELDVLIGRLERAAGADRKTLAPLFDRLEACRTVARGRLNEALAGAEFAALRDRLIAAGQEPELVGEWAEQSCGVVLPRLVRRVWRKLARRGRALSDEDPDEKFHEVRIRAKRARYAAEAVAPSLGRRASRDAARFARGAAQVQDVLGEHQDAVTARRTVKRLVAELPREEVVAELRRAARRLARTQARDARRTRARFFKVWGRLDRKENLRWLDP